MEIKHTTLPKAIMLMLLLCVSVTMMADTYPAVCKARTNLNVRVAPSVQYSRRGMYHRGDQFIVHSVSYNGGMNWGEVTYNGEIGYVCMNYVNYISPYEEEPVVEQPQTSVYSSPQTFWSKAWSIIKVVLIILAVIIVLAFWKQILQGIIYLSFFMGAGALITYLLFGNGGIGSMIGLIIGILLGIRYLSNLYGIAPSWPLRLFYNIISFPFYLLNKLQFFIVEPWRYLFKSNWLSDDAKSVVRPILYILKIVLYILSTPLRIVNAITYNIITHVCIGLYDLCYEVLAPSSDDEGGENFGSWLLYFPLRLVKYPIWHGFIILVEGIIWTIVDTFIPAITMYHGTDMTAAQAITCSTMRNEYLRRFKRWSDGAFTASQCCWGGKGVYFASMRSVARRYAMDGYRLSDDNPVMIVCRVSLGDVINYSLTPDYVYNNTGGNGNYGVLNGYAKDHGYNTGEWWNKCGGYWEFCMFDWQRKYNDLWRIRPIYIYSFKTGTFQHVKGGMQHWLFEKDILDDLKERLQK